MKVVYKESEWAPMMSNSRAGSEWAPMISDLRAGSLYRNLVRAEIETWPLTVNASRVSMKMYVMRSDQ